MREYTKQTTSCALCAQLGRRRIRPYSYRPRPAAELKDASAETDPQSHPCILASCRAYSFRDPVSRLFFAAP